MTNGHAFADSSYRAGSQPVRADTQTTRAISYLLLCLCDVLAIGFAFSAAEQLRNGGWDGAMNRRFLVALIPLFLFVSFYLRLYSLETMMSVSKALARLIVVLSVALGLHLAFAFIGKQSEEQSRIVFFAGTAGAFVLMALLRVAAVWIVMAVLKDRYVRRVLVIDGVPTNCPPSFEAIDAQQAGLSPDVLDPIMLHNFSTLIAGCDRVVVSCEPERRENWSMYLRGVGCSGELLLPELKAISPVHGERDLGWIGIRVSAGPLDLRDRVLKRAFDLGLTIPAIVVLAPFFALVAIAIKLDSPGRVLFLQRRMGQGNRLFNVYKFRSMIAAQADPDGKQSARRDDHRVTRVGRIIRTTSIDELPQLFNVLLGDMSLVGPRPHALSSTAGNQLFWDIDPRYWLRHAIKPGITGLAQVRGYRGATDHESDLTERLQSDLEYVGNWTLMKDFEILLRTAGVVMHHKAY